MEEKYKLEHAKIEDASYGLQSLMRRLVWLEKNGFVISETCENDIIGHGCRIYPDTSLVKVTITLQDEKVWRKYFEDLGREAMLHRIEDMTESTKKELS